MVSPNENYKLALSGLLHNPTFVAEIRQIVPEQWQKDVQKHLESATIKNAARFAAGLREQPAYSQQGKLLSIFCSLRSDGLSVPQDYYWPSTELKIEKDTLFPSADNHADNTNRDPWKDFLKQSADLREIYKNAGGESLSFFIENLVLLMQHYLWSKPCGLASLPDVSIYDHSRMTAALAALESKDVLLVGGDISGLQDFIYTITADGAASALRGRSLYLQLLNEILPRLILKTLGLPITNLIYAGGGNFYLLAKSDDKSELEGLRAQISQILLAHHRGDLYLALDSIHLEEGDFFDGEISKRWKNLGSALQRVKQKRFAELSDEILKELFKPQGDGGNEEKQCRVCGLEHLNTIDRQEDNKPRICPPCLEFEELGKKLRKANYLSIKQIGEISVPTLHSIPGVWMEVLKEFGFWADLSSRDDPPNVSSAIMFALKDKHVQLLKPRVDLVTGRRYFVNVTPSITEEEIKQLREKRKSEDEERERLDVENVKPFDVLQEQASGIKRLGVLRMDVDNLGRLFSDSMQKPNLARIASLSFAVSLYFEGWVERLAKERKVKDETNVDRLYSIYSGGDDLFFVGSWDAVIELAREIRRDLTRYAANHPGIHASAGIVLIGGKYPLYQAARDAGGAEERAKDFINAKGMKKNAITFLGQTVDWELFGTGDCVDLSTNEVHGLMHQLQDMLKTKENQPIPPRALLGILMNLQEKFSEEFRKRQLDGSDRNKRGEKQVLFGPWQWLGFYYLKRMVRREQNRNEDFAKKVERLTDQLQEKQFSNIEWIGLSARWAELLLRKDAS